MSVLILIFPDRFNGSLWVFDIYSPLNNLRNLSSLTYGNSGLLEYNDFIVEGTLISAHLSSIPLPSIYCSAYRCSF